MKLSTFLAWIAAGLLIVLGAFYLWERPASNGEKVLLRLDFKPGEKKSYGFQIEQEIHQEPASQPAIDVVQSIGAQFDIVIDRVDEEGNAHLTYTYKTVSFNLTSPMGSFEYDSEKSEDVSLNNPIMMGISQIPGKKFQVILTPRNEILEVKGADQIIQKVAASYADYFDKQIKQLEEQLQATSSDENDSQKDVLLSTINLLKEQQKQLTGDLEKRFGNEAIKLNFAKLSFTYPKNPIGLGDTATHTVTLVELAPIHLDSKATVEKLDQGIITFQVQATITSAPQNGQEGPWTFKDLSGEQKGWMTIDRKTGWQKEMDLNQEMKGQMELSQQQQSWPLEIRTHITLKELPQI